MNQLMVGLNSAILPVRAMLPAYAKVAAGPCVDPCSCAIVADATRASTELQQISQTAEQRVGDLLTSLSDAQSALAESVPKLGQTSATKASTDNGEFQTDKSAQIFSSSLARQGCRYGLPVEDDTFKTVCTRAKAYTPELVKKLADEKLQTMGSCKSGTLALADATPKLPQADTLYCKEAGAPPCGGSGPHPKKVAASAANGSSHMQFWSRVRGGDFDDARHAVDILEGTKGTDPKQASNVGFAQSEIYFDCEGTFAQCNQDQQAMYDTMWTARLRRVSTPTVSFAGDTTVKNEMADPARWDQQRSTLLSARQRFGVRAPTTAAGTILMAAGEGPLQ